MDSLRRLDGMVEADLRCPVTPQKLFGKVRARDRSVEVNPVDNTVEFACKWCRAARRQQGADVALVLHEYNLLGECVGTYER